jgi:hypothetical protein
MQPGEGKMQLMEPSAAAYSQDERRRHPTEELWVNLGDDGLREAAYRGG